MPFDASKVKRGEYLAGDGVVAEEEFDACAAALDEARKENEKLKGIVRKKKKVSEFSHRALVVREWW